MRSHQLRRPLGHSLLASSFLLLTSMPAAAQSLAGSAASLAAQNEVAALSDYTFLKTRADVTRFVTAGHLEKVPGNRDYELHAVSYPYARPEVRMFVERLAAQYRTTCRERMVVTSLTRPISEQPSNASDRSVHPTGMAVDLRRPPKGPCRTWLEKTLLTLETKKVLDVTLERNPQHLHVALFPESYASYVASVAKPAGAMAVAATAAAPAAYTVRAADTLWAIAKRFGITTAALKTANKLASDAIRVGQKLVIPSSRK